jgi:Flp pilus assembly pilin Flp
MPAIADPSCTLRSGTTAMPSSLPSTLLALGRCLVDNQRGATAIEYSVIVALIAMAITAALNITGQKAQVCSAPPATR